MSGKIVPTFNESESGQTHGQVFPSEKRDRMWKMQNSLEVCGFT